MAAVRHLEFMKYANFDILHGLRLKYVYLYKISSRSVERLQSYYKLIWRPSAILDLLYACAGPPTIPHWWSEEALKILSKSVE